MQLWKAEIQKTVNEFKEELGDYGKCLRLSALYEQLYDIEDEIIWRHEEYEKIMKNDGAYLDRAFIGRPLPMLEKKLKQLEMGIRCLVYEKSIKKGDITGEMIARAKAYPIENLLNIKCHMALCLNHSESHPSMNCKNNFVYCHSCGWTGDVIDVRMKLENLNFVEAVKSLQ